MSPLSKSAGFGEGSGEGSPSRCPSASARRRLLENSPSCPLAGPPRRFSPHAHLPPLLYPPFPQRPPAYPLHCPVPGPARTRGQTDLTTLVNQGCFSLAGNQVTLQPGLKKTWQLRTALLFMQLACQVSIRILRKSDRSHRSLFPLPSPFSLSPNPCSLHPLP